MQRVQRRQLAALAVLLLLDQACGAPLQWESIQPVGLRYKASTLLGD
jgi:hypothetical protein